MCASQASFIVRLSLSRCVVRPISLRGFHYRVHLGFLSNKTRVVLHDTRNHTYMFVVVQNLRSRRQGNENTVDNIIRNLQHGDSGYGTLGSDLLQLVDKENQNRVGYYFTQPTSQFRRKKGGTGPWAPVTSKVLTQRQWNKRLKAEKAQFDCHRRMFNEERKKRVSLAGCGPRLGCGATEERGSGVPHVPTLMIMSPDFNLIPGR